MKHLQCGAGGLADAGVDVTGLRGAVATPGVASFARGESLASSACRAAVAVAARIGALGAAFSVNFADGRGVGSGRDRVCKIWPT